MKFQIISTNHEILEMVKNESLFELQEKNSIDELIDEGIIFISSNIIAFSELENRLFKSAFVFYFQEQAGRDIKPKVIQALCDSKGYYYLSHTMYPSQQFKKIREIVSPNLQDSSKVMTFFSSTPNIGTTSTVISVAESLMRFSNKAKIGVLLLNEWEDGTEQLEYNGMYLNDLKTKISSQLFEKDEELLSCFSMAAKDRLYFLGGNKDLKLQHHYSPKEIKYLIDKSKKIFDVLLIDAGSHVDNASFVQSLHEADRTFVVMNQQPKAHKQFEQMYDQVLRPLGYKKDEFLMILNGYKDAVGLPDAKEIKQRLEMNLLITILDTPHGIKSEVEKSPLYRFDDTYQDSIHYVTRTIFKASNIENTIDETKNRKRLFSMK